MLNRECGLFFFAALPFRCSGSELLFELLNALALSVDKAVRLIEVRLRVSAAFLDTGKSC